MREHLQQFLEKHAATVASRRPYTHARRPDRRTAQLVADGRKALALRASGRAPMDVLCIIGGSRARMYKAMDAADRANAAASFDPLLA